MINKFVYQGLGEKKTIFPSHKLENNSVDDSFGKLLRFFVFKWPSVLTRPTVLTGNLNQLILKAEA